MERPMGLYRVGLRVPELEAASRFYQHSWAMELVESGAEELSFRSYGQDHNDLVVRAGSGGLDHIGLSVKNGRALDALLQQVEDGGYAIKASVKPGARPGEALTAVIEDLDGNRLELVVPAGGISGTPLAKAAPSYTRKLGHIVMWTSQIDAQEAFYAALGFRVCDRTHLGMSFLRCNNDHHSIALAKSDGSKQGLQHVAYDIGAIDDVMREFARLRNDGLTCIWGVGRHGPGNNVFAYYCDPAGNVVENYGDMEKVTEIDVPQIRFWGSEHKGDIWGVAGPAPMPFQGQTP